MNKIHSLWLCVTLLIMLGCDNEKRGKATLTIKSKSQPNAEVKLNIFNGLDNVSLTESKTDSIGSCSLEIALQKPIFAGIQVGNKYAEVYLSPGSDLNIEEVGLDYQVPLRFSGNGAQINNYISWINSNVEKIKWANGIGLIQLDHKGFEKRYDSLETTINAFHAAYIDSVKLPDEILSKLQYKNRIKLNAITEEFRFFKLNDLMNQNWQPLKESKGYITAALPKELGDLSNGFLFDTLLLVDGYSDYRMLLTFYWHNQINLPTSEQLRLSKASVNSGILISNALIKKINCPESIREFFIAFSLQYWLSRTGITPETDSVFASFKKAYPNSEYVPSITRNYNEWLALAAGKPAPDFEGHTPEGKKVSINDFKGKIVYLDIWATWCGPCVAEIPAAKKLQQEFSNEEKIVFLEVSVDRNKTDWKNFLKKDPNWKGLHINVEPDKILSLYNKYKLEGVPGFVLIDESGSIVNVKAPRPSEEGEIKKEIRKLLSKKS